MKLQTFSERPDNLDRCVSEFLAQYPHITIHHISQSQSEGQYGCHVCLLLFWTDDGEPMGGKKVKIN